MAVYGEKETFEVQVKKRFIAEVNDYGLLSDQELLERIDQRIGAESKAVLIPLRDKERLKREIFNTIRKMDVLQDLLDNPDITEIMVNGSENIFVEENGRMRFTEKSFQSSEKLHDIIQRMVGKVNRIVNETNPIVDARLSDGSRLHVVLPPISLNGPVVTIRKFKTAFTMDGLVEIGTMPQGLAEFLATLVRKRYNIFISGGTGSGKTTYLNALSGCIPADERIITIEDAAELNIQGIANLVRLETRNPNLEGENEVDMSTLIRAALRMRPDRIIVGEVRGKEALYMLQAMNTGHDGSISTGHGNSPADMLLRLETMVLMGANLPLEAVRSQVTSAIDLLIHLGRLKDGSRKVIAVTEVTGMNQGAVVLNQIFHYQEETEVVYEKRMVNKSKLEEQ